MEDCQVIINLIALNHVDLASNRVDMSAPVSVEIGTLITRTPGIKRGTPHIAGTGVTVRTIARWYKLGLSAEEIAAEIPHLTLAQVCAALAYYHANLEDMEAHMAAEEAESDKIEQEHLRDRPAGRVSFGFGNGSPVVLL